MAKDGQVSRAPRTAQERLAGAASFMLSGDFRLVKEL
jgi:hypothetical protein